MVGLESGVIGVVERGIKYSFIEPRLIAQGRPKCYLSCEGCDRYQWPQPDGDGEAGGR